MLVCTHRYLRTYIYIYIYIYNYVVERARAGQTSRVTGRDRCLPRSKPPPISGINTGPTGLWRGLNARLSVLTYADACVHTGYDLVYNTIITPVVTYEASTFTNITAFFFTPNERRTSLMHFYRRKVIASFESMPTNFFSQAKISIQT